MTEKVEVVFLGTAASLPQKNRMQSCTAIRFRDYTLIVDMGEGAQNQIREYKIKTSNKVYICLLYTSPSPRDLSTSRMPSSA